MVLEEPGGRSPDERHGGDEGKGEGERHCPTVTGAGLGLGLTSTSLRPFHNTTSLGE